MRLTTSKRRFVAFPLAAATCALFGFANFVISANASAENEPAPEFREHQPQDNIADAKDRLVEFMIGPVAGLTTKWHPAPERTYIPRGTIVELRAAARPDSTVIWHGADEMLRSEDASIARCTIDALGNYEIRAHVVGQDVGERMHRIEIRGVKYPAEQIVVQPIEVTAEPIELHAGLSNEERVGLYFGPAISPLVQVADGHWRTTENRQLRLNMEVFPAGFAPLIEWRVDGQAKYIGTNKWLSLGGAEMHTISAGPLANEQTVQVETYRVSVEQVIPAGEDLIPEDIPVTFRATTTPPGYEDEIVWLSSTKYGSAEPVLGQGAEFTVVFQDTWGPHPAGGSWSWSGVKANSAVRGQDQKVACDNQDDLFATDPFIEGTQICFGDGDHLPIPADFFGPGSDPFVGCPPLAGFASEETGLGLTDTIVRRMGGGPNLTNEPIGAQQTVPIEIRQLNLVSAQPIVVTSNGGQNPEQWFVAVALSPSQPQLQGTLTATKTHATGGTATATVPVTPIFVFAPESDLQDLQSGIIQPEDVRIRVSDGPFTDSMEWQGTAPYSDFPPNDGSFFCPPGNGTFYPGHDTSGTRGNLPPHVPPGSPGTAHFTCPPPPPPPGLCTYTLFATLNFGCPPGTCPAFGVGKMLLLCAPAPGPCPFFAPCPPFAIAAFPCPGGFCIGFYFCTACAGC